MMSDVPPKTVCISVYIYIYMDLSANRLPSDPSVYDSSPEVVCSADKIPWNLVAVTQIIHVWDMYAQSMPTSSRTTRSMEMYHKMIYQNWLR